MNNLHILKWYQQMGVDEVISVDKNNYLLHAAPYTSNSINDFAALSDIIADARNKANEAQNLSELEEIVNNWGGCQLKKTANKTVFCDGNPNTDVMLIGEAPGASEDLEGIPFCGDAGKLLDNMIGAINLTRQNSYITNVLFWRPPGNRKPTPEELAICQPFVEKHIALINPKVIIIVGSTAASVLLPDAKETISQLRTRHHSYTNCYLTKPITASIIFHPSYLIRQPLQKKSTWHDLQLIRKLITQQN
ncbi:MAG: hypothetical protein RIT35_2 [Pseudomonadota bacterium]|jgi:DNA polymerase